MKEAKKHVRGGRAALGLLCAGILMAACTGDIADDGPTDTAGGSVHVHLQIADMPFSIQYRSDYGDVPQTVERDTAFTATADLYPPLHDATHSFCGWYRATADGEELVLDDFAVQGHETLRAAWKDMDIGDVIVSDGSVLGLTFFTAWNSSPAAAAIVCRLAQEGRPMAGIGLSMLQRELWSHNVTAVESEVATQISSTNGFIDGTSGKENTRIMTERYPTTMSIFRQAKRYGTQHGFSGPCADGWYIPSVEEMYGLYRNMARINESYRAVTHSTRELLYRSADGYAIWTSSSVPYSTSRSYSVHLVYATDEKELKNSADNKRKELQKYYDVIRFKMDGRNHCLYCWHEYRTRSCHAFVMHEF